MSWTLLLVWGPVGPALARAERNVEREWAFPCDTEFSRSMMDSKFLARHLVKNTNCASARDRRRVEAFGRGTWPRCNTGREMARGLSDKDRRCPLKASCLAIYWRAVNVVRAGRKPCSSSSSPSAPNGRRGCASCSTARWRPSSSSTCSIRRRAPLLEQAHARAGVSRRCASAVRSRAR